MNKGKNLREVEKKKRRKELWKQKAYPFIKVIMIAAICVAITAPDISGALLVNAGESAETLGGEEVFPQGGVKEQRVP